MPNQARSCVLAPWAGLLEPPSHGRVRTLILGVRHTGLSKPWRGPHSFQRPWTWTPQARELTPRREAWSGLLPWYGIPREQKVDGDKPWTPMTCAYVHTYSTYNSAYNLLFHKYHTPRYFIRTNCMTWCYNTLINDLTSSSAEVVRVTAAIFCFANWPFELRIPVSNPRWLKRPNRSKKIAQYKRPTSLYLQVNRPEIRSE